MANAEQLAMILHSVGEWNEWRKNNEDEQIDLSGADLRWANLIGANLSGANLTGATGLSKLPSSDPRGFDAYVQSCDDGRCIKAGCRYLTLSEGRDHWGQRYKGDRKIGDHYLWLIDLAEAAPEQDGVIDVIGALRCLQQSTT